MKITRKSMLSGVERTMDINVTYEQIQQWEIGNKPIQQVMPDLTDYEREFIMTGITEQEWDAAFSDEE